VVWGGRRLCRNRNRPHSGGGKCDSFFLLEGNCYPEGNCTPKVEEVSEKSQLLSFEMAMGGRVASEVGENGKRAFFGARKNEPST